MKSKTLAAALLVACLPQAQIPEGMTPLLKPDLSGWHWSLTTHHGSTGKAVYEDDALFLSQEPYGQGGLFMTDKRYRNFELYLETDIPWGLNSGIFLRSTESGSAYQIELVSLASDSPAMTALGSLIGEGVAVQLRPSDLRLIWKERLELVPHPHDRRCPQRHHLGERPTSPGESTAAQHQDCWRD